MGSSKVELLPSFLPLRVLTLSQLTNSLLTDNPSTRSTKPSTICMLEIAFVVSSTWATNSYTRAPNRLRSCEESHPPILKWALGNGHRSTYMHNSGMV